MARIFNAEKSQFMQQATQIYNQNRVSQYSKYLDSNPFFVTYYSINNVMTRTDALGQVYDELGPSSPLRFNKITELPVYKINLIQPNGSYEDGNYDVEIELNDITILPNTVRPRPYDYFCLELPNCKKLLFRVNAFRNNTIQSNDFYSIDADLREGGEHCCDAIERQVVETYHCVFEKIGTQDSCFIKPDDETAANSCMETIETLSAMYHDLFYHETIGDYIFCPDYTKGYHHDRPYTCYYDIYLAKFINDSMLFFTGDYATTSVVTYDDNEPKMFDFMYKHTLWYALTSKSTRLLARYPYYFGRPIEKTFSPILYYINGQCFGFDLVLDSKTPQSRRDLGEYFPHKLITLLLDGKTTTTSKSATKADFEVIDLDGIAAKGNRQTIYHTAADGSQTYITKAKNNTINTGTSESSDVTEDSDGCDAIYDMVYTFLNGDSVSYDAETLINTMYHYTLWSYHMIPVVIYVLKGTYSNYFKNIQ